MDSQCPISLTNRLMVHVYLKIMKNLLRIIVMCQVMIFDSVEDAKTCCTTHARRVGFCIKFKHNRLPKSDKSLIGVDYACSREGQPKHKD
ncbi:hypothetical protein MIMGU_mgv11b017765mg [Erythranthe guttata]|uniref:Uncharacterized protein n=1 Tax=Erythranthe guttata TaxID=4155 RepID=A0A022QCH2_ERYGU|nr:hypothetical protein MIMGU_mgv11b017765mg [Erythranthe guttata]